MPTVRPRLALTMGDYAGIGPELVLRVLSEPGIKDICRLLVYGNLPVLRRVSTATGIPLPCSLVVVPHNKGVDRPPAGKEHVLFDLPFEEAETLVPGQVQSSCGVRAYEWICLAVKDIKRGIADALVTAPINKEALHLAGIKFPGHTELLADLTQTPAPCMAFYSERFLVSLATIHEALADVPRLLSVSSLTRTIRLTHAACRGFGTRAPRIGVLALNPHAGENGLFGREEQTVILPAITNANAENMDVFGPLVPDTAFTWLLTGASAPFDAFVAMYHDQGLIPFKMVAFDTGVNVTLGLPIIRTSPDHGTAFDLAWQGKASDTSLLSAITLAARMAASTQAAPETRSVANCAAEAASGE